MVLAESRNAPRGQIARKIMPKSPTLQTVPTAELMKELLRRPHGDFVRQNDGLLTDEAFMLRDIIGIALCLDGAAARRNERNQVELMAMLRNTGPYAGKWVMDGGHVNRIYDRGVWQPEGIEGALKRNFKIDLGFDIELLTSWDRPSACAQEMRPVGGVVRPNFGEAKDRRHVVALRYLVEIIGNHEPVFGSTRHGGQEGGQIAWFTRASLPPAEKFGYGQYRTFADFFPIADTLLPKVAAHVDNESMQR